MIKTSQIVMLVRLYSHKGKLTGQIMLTNASSTFQNEVPEIFSLLISIHENISECGICTNLANLIMLRVSQINQCAYCVELHTREARTANETNNRLDQLIVFKQSNCFTEKEKITLAWAEQLTYLTLGESFEGLRIQLLTYYSERELSAITMLVCMINTWNRIRKSGS